MSIKIVLSKSEIEKNCGVSEAKYYSALDKISRLEVLARYLIFRNLLPYTGILENYLDDNIKSFLKEIFWRENIIKLNLKQ